MFYCCEDFTQRLTVVQREVTFIQWVSRHPEPIKLVGAPLAGWIAIYQLLFEQLWQDLSANTNTSQVSLPSSLVMRSASTTLFPDCSVTEKKSLEESLKVRRHKHPIL